MFTPENMAMAVLVFMLGSTLFVCGYSAFCKYKSVFKAD